MRRHVMTVAVLAGLLGACGAAEAEPPSFVEWCASVSVDGCASMATSVAAGEVDPGCVVRTAGMEEAFECFNQAVPETTIPTDEPMSAPPGSRAFIDDAVIQTLAAAHPDSMVTVALALFDPITLDEAGALAAQLQGLAVAVWRVDQVCATPAGGFPEGQEPTRFAFIDGVERAAAERLAADEGRTVVTGRHIAEGIWKRMEQAAAALTPNTEVVAVALDVTAGSVPSLTGDTSFELVRLAPPGVEYAFDEGDLPAPAPLTCGG